MAGSRFFFVSEIRRAAGKLPYLGQCDHLRLRFPEGEDFWQAMMHAAQPIPLDELERNVEVAAILDDEETLGQFVESDPDAAAFRAVVNGDPVYFLQVAGFEFIFADPNVKASWTRRGTIDPLRDIDTPASEWRNWEGLVTDETYDEHGVEGEHPDANLYPHTHSEQEMHVLNHVGMAVATDLDFRNETTGHSHGQTDGRLLALREGKPVGYIDWSQTRKDIVHIRMLEVLPDARRSGVGSALMYQLRREFPGAYVDEGYKTDDGVELVKTIEPSETADPRVQEDLEHDLDYLGSPEHQPSGKLHEMADRLEAAGDPRAQLYRDLAALDFEQSDGNEVFEARRRLLKHHVGSVVVYASGGISLNDLTTEPKEDSELAVNNTDDAPDLRVAAPRARFGALRPLFRRG